MGWKENERRGGKIWNEENGGRKTGKRKYRKTGKQVERKEKREKIHDYIQRITNKHAS